MGREIKRVPVDFNHEIGQIWPGYLPPAEMTDEEIDAWIPDEPPAGEGWQMWETTTEGSPLSPVFATDEELAQWISRNPCGFAGMTPSLESARSFIKRTAA